MINVYENYRDTDGNSINGRTILFLRDSDTDESGSILTYTAGPGVSADVSGRIFIVDEWLISQLDKVKFVDGVLSVKDGEELIPPVKTEKQKEMEELQRRMAELQATPDEPLGTEEQLLLENTEEPAPE